MTNRQEKIPAELEEKCVNGEDQNDDFLTFKPLIKFIKTVSSKDTCNLCLYSREKKEFIRNVKLLEHVSDF